MTSLAKVRAGSSTGDGMTAGIDERPSTLRDYLQIVWRRKWVVLQAVILVPLVAVMWSLREPPLYEASAAVFVNPQNLAANLQNVPDPSQLDSGRQLRTQLELARVPEVARRTLDAAGPDGWYPSDLLEASNVTIGDESDILTFYVRNEDARLATRLATEYANQFTVYARELQTSSLVDARTAAEKRIAALERADETDSRLYESLLEQRERLQTMEALQTTRAVVVRPATGAGQIQPQPMRNAIIGAALGLFLGLGLAALLEALDSRVRSARRIAGALHLPLLARIARPPRQERQRERLVMDVDPASTHAEAFRVLRTNVDLVNIEPQARTIMVTSAVKNEGKSTTIANLAVALARAGRFVTLVDLDLRAPQQNRFFGLERQPGLTDVAYERVSLAEALVEVQLTWPAPMLGKGRGRNREGGLELLPSGALPGNPGEFLTQVPLRAILDKLHERSDIVLIDAPPFLGIGDAVTLSSSVDAMIVVARLNRIRTGMLEELRRTLDACPSRKLGLVVTGAESETEYEYVAYRYDHPNWSLEAVQPPEVTFGLSAGDEPRTTRGTGSGRLS